jgi:hypothetical protein
MGHADGTIKVSGYSNRIYARILQGGKYFPIEAVNLGAPLIWGKAIRLNQADDGTWYVLGLDEERSLEADTDTPLGTAGQHSHEKGQGYFDPVSEIRILTGLVHINTGDDLTVYIEPLYYTYQGTRKMWAGGIIDLTAYVPGTTGEWAWVKVGINPATNAAAAEAGTAKSIFSALLESELQSIDFADKIQLGAVRLRNGQTVINDPDDFYSIREWLIGDAGGNTLDEAYDQGGAGSGRAITADIGPVQITVPDATADEALHLEQNDLDQAFIDLDSDSGEGQTGTTATYALADEDNIASEGSIIGWAKVKVSDASAAIPSVAYVPLYSAPTLASPASNWTSIGLLLALTRAP